MERRTMSEFCLIHGPYVGQTVPGCPICKFQTQLIYRKPFIIDEVLTELWGNKDDSEYDK